MPRLPGPFSLHVVHYEVAGRLALPAFVALKNLRADKPVTGRLAGEYPHNPCPALHFGHDPLHHVCRVDPPPMFRGKPVDRQGLLELLPYLPGHARILALPTRRYPLRLGHAHRHLVELARGAQLFGKGLPVLVAHLPKHVAHEMGPAPLPRHLGKLGAQRRPDALVAVGDQPLNPRNAPLPELPENLRPGVL